MDISASEELSKPILTAEAVRQTLPQVCLKDDGSPKAEKSIQNILSGFNQMLKLGLLDESRLAEQMESEFELTKKTVKRHEAIHGKKSWPSFLNDIRAAANIIINFDTSGMTFAHTLTVLAGKEFGVFLSKTKLSESLHKAEPAVSANTYYCWMTGQNTPRFKRTIDAISSLDKKLNWNGSLSTKIKKLFQNRPEKDPNKEKKIPFVLPSLLNKEMNEYIDFRLNNKKPKEMSYLQKMVPKSKEESQKLRHLKKIINKTWELPSSTSFNDQVVFLAKYVQEEHPDEFESMSLSTFFNHDIMENFAQYTLNKGTITFGLNAIKWIKSECSKKSYASNYLCSKDQFCSNIDDWIEELEFFKIDLEDMEEILTEDYERLEGARNIDWILQKDNPVSYINSISKELWRDANFSSEAISPTASAIMFDMLLPCPLRAKNVWQLRWLGSLSSSEIRELHKIHTCALYFDENKGCYTIFVHKQKLKNRKSKTIKSIIQSLPHLSEKFSHYLSVREAHLKKKGWTTDTLFPLMRVSAQISESRFDELGNIVDFTLGKTGIYNLISKATETAINICFPEENILRGINPHGMRHLAASLFLRDFPENYTALATLLMDNLETVTKIYARRDDVGNHEKIANWAEGLMGLSNAA